MFFNDEPTAKRSWLVQRLIKPSNPAVPDAAGNPFAFGGGLRRGGLSEDASQLLGTAFDFDYMGAAEYEMGAVPEALQKVFEHAKEGQLVTATLDVPMFEVVGANYKTNPDDTRTKTVYVLANKSHLESVLERIAEWARNEYKHDVEWKRQYEVRDSIGLTRTLQANEDDEDAYWQPYGWLELENGFFFFADETMFRTTASIFGIDVE